MLKLNIPFIELNCYKSAYFIYLKKCPPMEIVTSCNTSSLNVYVPTAQNPWNEQKVNHVLRRLGYGANTTEIAVALAQTPENFIDGLVDVAINTLPMLEPSWANMTYQDYINAGLDFDEETQNNHRVVYNHLFNGLLNSGLNGKMSLFWSNHFVTQLSVYYCSNYLYKYYNVLQTHAFGNFKDFVSAMGKTEAMLLYLNGFQNSLYDANENYARELYELFTLGVNNGYTQTDIVETSKALTGYNHWNDFCDTIYFDNSTFNGNDKTIFGQTGNWNYDDVINILFQEKAPLIANFICTKLYKYFVSPTVNESIVAELATAFQVDFNIENVLRTLFKSEHFFDENSIGSQIKSPYDLTHNYLKTTGFSINDDYKQGILYLNSVAGQELFEPVDVAGWQGDHDWINSSTLTGRWQIIEYLIWHTWNDYNEELRTFAIDSSNNSNDPYVVTKSIIDRFVPKELHTTTDYDIATDIFKFNIPQNYYDNQQWSLYWDQVPYQVVLLLLHIIKMPEFQLK